MPDITDYFGKGSLDSDYAVATTVSATRSPGASVLEAVDLSKFADDTPVFVVTYKKVTDPVTEEITVSELRSFKALVNTGANTLTNLTIAPGYVDDLGNDEGDFIECIPTSYWVNELIDGLFVSLNPDGTIKLSAIQEATPDYGLLQRERVYTANDTWVKPAGLKFVIIEVQAGGGGVGQAGSTTSGQASEASSGGGGEYARGKVLAEDLGATEAVTVGAGGAAGVSTGNGGTGGTSSFGAHLTAIGGGGGLYMAGDGGSIFNPGGVGGTGGSTGGDTTDVVRIPGGRGGAAAVISGATLSGGRRNVAGASHMSTSDTGAGTAAASSPIAGRNYGAGAVGGRNGASSSASGAAAGGAGIVIVREYF